MFNFFRSKKANPKAKSKGPAPAAKAPAIPKMRKVNLDRRFAILAETNQGSMSHVYKAFDNEQQRSVCLKVQDAPKTTDALTRAVKEGRPPEGWIGTQIRHVNVVRTFDYGLSTKKEHWLSMEYVEGISLGEIRKIGSRDLAGKVGLLIQIADGLAAIHSAGYIHHDFGPKNVLVSRENVAKIIDFGLAVPDQPQFHRPGNRTGTLQYMAPELIRRESTDRRLDVFSYGVMAFELLTNRLPYDATADQMTMMHQRMNADPLDIAVAAPGLPSGLCDAINKAIARRKEDRWSTMNEVAEALRELGIAQEP